MRERERERQRHSERARQRDSERASERESAREGKSARVQEQDSKRGREQAWERGSECGSETARERESERAKERERVGEQERGHETTLITIFVAKAPGETHKRVRDNGEVISHSVGSDGWTFSVATGAQGTQWMKDTAVDPAALGAYLGKHPVVAKKYRKSKQPDDRKAPEQKEAKIQ